MRLFLISGKAGSGKDEVASIVKKYYQNTVVTSFSKYIKLYAKELTDWDGSDETKPREFLQNMGDRLRAVSENFLTNRVLEDLKVYESCGITNVVISDVRLINEVEFFKKIKDINLVLIRVNAKNSKRNLTDSEKKHHTELELDNYDKFNYVIENKFDENLEKEVIKILEGMK